MRGHLEMLNPGVQSTIQDRGRLGFQELGVPICGTVIPHWMMLANALVGNPDHMAGVEFRVLGPTLKAVNGSVKLAVCGNVPIEITTHTPGGVQTRHLSGWRSFTLNPDDELKIGALEHSVAGFIAVSGGLDISDVMLSRSTYVRSGFGGLEGRPLAAGDRLYLNESAEAKSLASDKVLPSPPVNEAKSVRVVLGPQKEYFSHEALENFLGSEFKISRASDRMGARLEGPELEHHADYKSEIVSDGVAPGAIQVPGNGQPIVLLNDAQTVGGYPKIATVISCDLHKVANAVAGTSLRFEAVNAHDACLLTRRWAEETERLKNTFVSASLNGFVNIKALYENNLIDGVVDMHCPDHFCGHLEEPTLL